MAEFGATLAEIMRRRYIAEIDVARELGVSPTVVAQWLSGATSPTPADVAHLALLLGDEEARTLEAAAANPACEEHPDSPNRPLCEAEQQLLAYLPGAFRAAFAAAFARS